MPDLAMEWLQKAYQERTDVLVWLKRDPIYDPLAANPRFKAIVRQVLGLYRERRRIKLRAPGAAGRGAFDTAT
jgi:hypothetical protein